MEIPDLKETFLDALKVMATALAGAKGTLILGGAFLLKILFGSLIDRLSDKIEAKLRKFISSLPKKAKASEEEFIEYLKENMRNPQFIASMEALLLEILKDEYIRRRIEANLAALTQISSEEATIVSSAFAQLETLAPTQKHIKELKEAFESTLQKLGQIEKLVRYYTVPLNRKDILEQLGLPHYIDRVLILDEERKALLERAVENILNAKNVAIVGGPGLGKTTLLYAIIDRLSKIMNVAFLEDVPNISNEHARLGYVLVVDNLSVYEHLINALKRKRIDNLVVTIRDYEWDLLPANVKSRFVVIHVPPMSESVIRKLAMKFFSIFEITYDDEALDIVIKKASGNPNYIRFLAEDLSKTTRRLTREIASKVPSKMNEYVSKILENILLEKGELKNGGRAVIITLLCLADIPGFETHELHLDRIYLNATSLAREITGETMNETLYETVKHLLYRDTLRGGMKFPHDVFADILAGKTELRIGNIIGYTRHNIAPASIRKKIIIEAAREGLDIAREEYMSGANPSIILNYLYYMTRIFNPKDLDRLGLDIRTIESIAKAHIDIPTSKSLLATFLSIETATDITKETIGHPESKHEEVPKPIKIRISEIQKKEYSGISEELGVPISEREQVDLSKLKMAIAINEFKKGAYSKAEELFRSLNTVEAQWNLILTLIAKGQIDKAIEILKKYPKLRDDEQAKKLLTLIADPKYAKTILER